MADVVKGRSGNRPTNANDMTTTTTDHWAAIREHVNIPGDLFMANNVIEIK